MYTKVIRKFEAEARNVVLELSSDKTNYMQINTEDQQITIEIELERVEL